MRWEIETLKTVSQANLLAHDFVIAEPLNSKLKAELWAASRSTKICHINGSINQWKARMHDWHNHHECTKWSIWAPDVPCTKTQKVQAEASQCDGSDTYIVTHIAKLVRQKPFPKFLGQVSLAKLKSVKRKASSMASSMASSKIRKYLEQKMLRTKATSRLCVMCQMQKRHVGSKCYLPLFALLMLGTETFGDALWHLFCARALGENGWCGNDSPRPPYTKRIHVVFKSLRNGSFWMNVGG